jgi:MHS family proline/betaine transporter-like MFS transporter
MDIGAEVRQTPAQEQQASGALDARRRRAIIAGIVGNTLEWYDFGVYGFVATVLARQFFPASDPYVALLQTFGAFAAGFVARPFGSFLLGRLGDRIGRRALLTITILMMAFGTIVIGTLPTYAQIGFYAPLILLFARLLQGFAAGGEWGTAAAFLAEWSTPGRRGFYGGLLLSSVSGGLLLGSGVAALVTTLLTQEQLFAWGWRIPFLLGIVLIPVGLYLRRNVEEPPVFQLQKALPRAVVRGEFIPLVVRGAFLCMPLLVASYMATVYMPSFAQLHGHIARSAALWTNTAALALTVIAAPLFGHLSDRWGRKRQMMIAGVAMAAVSWPVFALIASGVSFPVYAVAHLFLTLTVVLGTSAAPACIAELFPTASRSVGASLGNALAGVLGGSSPAISTWLIGTSGIVASPALLVIFAGAASFLALIGMREMTRSELR